VFFSQVGTPLIKSLGEFDEWTSSLHNKLQILPDVTDIDFVTMRAIVAHHNGSLDAAEKI
jgi:hypothetical protein